MGIEYTSGKCLLREGACVDPLADHMIVRPGLLSPATYAMYLPDRSGDHGCDR